MLAKEKGQMVVRRDAVQIPTINERQRIPDQVIEDAVRQIIQKFQPQRIMLFGS